MASEADYIFFRDETPKSLPLSGSWSSLMNLQAAKVG